MCTACLLNAVCICLNNVQASVKSQAELHYWLRVSLSYRCCILIMFCAAKLNWPHSQWIPVLVVYFCVSKAFFKWQLVRTSLIKVHNVSDYCCSCEKSRTVLLVVTKGSILSEIGLIRYTFTRFHLLLCKCADTTLKFLKFIGLAPILILLKLQHI